MENQAGECSASESGGGLPLVDRVEANESARTREDGFARWKANGDVEEMSSFNSEGQGRHDALRQFQVCDSMQCRCIAAFDPD